jgi:hypothetical protein
MKKSSPVFSSLLIAAAILLLVQLSRRRVRRI